jgi:hypothetical protein
VAVEAAPARARALRGRREDSRLGRLRASHSYGLVLGLIVATFLFAATASEGRWTSSVLVVLVGLTLVCALWTSGRTHVMARAGTPLLVFALVTAVGNLIEGGRTWPAALWIFACLLVLCTMVAIGLGVVDQGEVNKQSVRGAVAVYLQLGLVFTFLYGAVAVIGSSPFFAQGTDGTRALRTYFSYVTLATLGYGDYSPAGTVGHTLAIVEALTGQLYLVTVVALLVSRLGRRPPVIPPG